MSNTGRAVRSVANVARAADMVRAPHQARIIALPAPERAAPERPSKLKAFGALLSVGLVIAAAVAAVSVAVRSLLVT